MEKKVAAKSAKKQIACKALHNQFKAALKEIGVTPPDLLRGILTTTNKKESTVCQLVYGSLSPVTGKGRFSDLAYEVAAFLDVLPEQLWGDPLQRALKKLGVLSAEGDAILNQETRLNLLGINPPEHVTDPYDSVEKDELGSYIIPGVLKTLKTQEQQVLTLRFGLTEEQTEDTIGNQHPDSLTLDEVGKIMELSIPRIQQIQDIALRKLRHQSRAIHLRPYDI